MWKVEQKCKKSKGEKDRIEDCSCLRIQVSLIEIRYNQWDVSNDSVLTQCERKDHSFIRESAPTRGSERESA